MITNKEKYIVNFLRAVLLFLLVDLMPIESRGQQFQNGDFELTSFQTEYHPPEYDYRALTPGNTNINGWITTTGYGLAAPDGVIEYIRGYFQDPQQSTGGHVELGFYYTLAGIKQTFATAPNQNYTVNFYLASNPHNIGSGSAILRVSAGGSFADYAAAPGSGSELDMGWQLKQFDFVADGSGTTTLQFWNLQGIAAIDGVTVIPEPQSCMLVVFAACCFSALNSKRKHGNQCKPLFA